MLVGVSGTALVLDKVKHISWSHDSPKSKQAGYDEMNDLSQEID